MYGGIKSEGLLLGCRAEGCVGSKKWTFTIISSPDCFPIFHGELSSVNHESTLKGAILKVNKKKSDFAIVFRGGTKKLSAMTHLINSLDTFESEMHEKVIIHG